MEHLQIAFLDWVMLDYINRYKKQSFVRSDI